MLKCSVLSSMVFALVVSGCATVSVLPGSSTIVETKISQEQSDLRQASEAFSQTAISRGWINDSKGFFDLARVLVEGRSETDTHTKTYAVLIGADMRAPDDVRATLTTDLHDAASALSEVSVQAEAFLDIDPVTRAGAIREDLVGFERSLVQAQQSRRAFIEAAKLAELATHSDILSGLETLDAEIDRARSLADRLAVEYANRGTEKQVAVS